MSFAVAEACRETRTGEERVGFFRSIQIGRDWTSLVVAEPQPALQLVGPGPVPDGMTVGRHVFPIRWVRARHFNATFPVLIVRPGDPVEWLPRWRWLDPRLAAVWPEGRVAA